MTDVQPPAHVAPYVEALGETKAVEFLMEFGGGVAYLSGNPQPGSDLCNLIGRDGVVALASQIGDGPLRIPTAKPYLAAVFEARGKNRQQIARTLHVTDVTVRSWLNGKTDPRQQQLI